MYNTILTALRGTGIPFADVAWANAPAGDYGTFGLSGAYDALWADNHMRSQTLEAMVHLFTRSSGLEQLHTIQGVLDGLEVSYYLNSIQYEDNTGFMHLEWIVSWVDAAGGESDGQDDG